MRRFLAACRAACCVLVVMSLARPARAQTWNAPRTRALVEQATLRRAQQLADTGLADYQANAHGYVTFLAQLGAGYLTPPKLLKADELVSEVYWRAPNLSKQRIIGRRDTLLLPTDIQYHRDHLGIVQNNFPNIIRLGDGDEVADVPHPLSPTGLAEYDFAITDSLPIQFPGGKITVFEVKVRPKDERQPRVIGAVYIEPTGGQVVRMAFNFTRAAFLDKQLEGLEIVLENGLVGTRFWLPRRQEIEIRRSGTWLDYPVRGIIRGRWDIGDYRFNLRPANTVFQGQEIIQAPPDVLKRYPWKGQVLDALPPDIRAVTDANIAQVQAEARRLVTAQALAHVHSTALSARGISDFARFDRVEGFAAGAGVSRRFGAGFSATVRGRYGIDDRDGKGDGTLAWQSASGFGVRAYGMREFRDVGDVQERSLVVNSIAAQEFGSDYTDPYFVRGGGLGLDFGGGATRLHVDGSVERQSRLEVHARPVTGVFKPPVAATDRRAIRAVLALDRSPSLWFFGTELTAHVEAAGILPRAACGLCDSTWSLRSAIDVQIERPFGVQRLVTRISGVRLERFGSHAELARQDLAYFGGTMSGPGYDFHSLWSTLGGTGRLEWHFPSPFIPFSLGRFGRVPARGTFAPFVQAVAIRGVQIQCAIPDGGAAPQFDACGTPVGGVYPSAGMGILSPFDLLRVDVARGLRDGRWTFSIDMTREFWKIL